MIFRRTREIWSSKIFILLYEKLFTLYLERRDKWNLLLKTVCIK